MVSAARWPVAWIAFVTYQHRDGAVWDCPPIVCRTYREARALMAATESLMKRAGWTRDRYAVRKYIPA